MSDSKAEHDPSMEEILSSIRRIISEEGVSEEAAGDATPEGRPDLGEEGVGDIDEGDVLELTDILKDDGSVVNASEDDDEAPDDEDEPEEPEEEEALQDSVDAGDDLDVAFIEEAETLPESEKMVESEKIAAPEEELEEVAAAAAPEEEGLVSPKTAAASVGAFANLSQAITQELQATGLPWEPAAEPSKIWLRIFFGPCSRNGLTTTCQP